MNNNYKCDICGTVFNTEKRLFRHWTSKSKCILQQNTCCLEKKVTYIEKTRNIEIKELIKKYNQNELSLKEISRQLNIDFKLTKSIFIYRGLKMRSLKESIQLNNKKLELEFQKKYNVKNFGELGNLKKYRDKAKKTSLKHYGVEIPSQAKIIKEKIKHTVQDRFGVDNVFQNNDIKKKIRESNLLKYGVEIPAQSEEVKQKYKKTMISKYGVEYYSQTDDFKRRYKNTMLKKYGVENYFYLKSFKKFLEDNRQKIIEKQRQTNEKNGLWVKLTSKTNLEIYTMKVRNITQKHIKKIFEDWNGLCYYTKQKLIPNEEYCLLNKGKHPNTNKLAPTIDHKISIVYGFLNNIPPEKIADINNLCICAKYINSKKHRKIEIEFIKLLEDSMNNEN